MMNVLIIGGVAAGMSAAAKLKRNLGDKVAITVFEKTGDVSYAACGIPFYVSGHIRDENDLYARSLEEFAKAGVDVRVRHEAVAVDTAAKTVSVRNLDTGGVTEHAYDKLIVASGAKVRKIRPLDTEWDNLFLVRTVGDGTSMRAWLEREDVKTVVVVGAGFIGLEIAEACARQGKHVRIVEFAERILSVMDPEITDQLHLELKKNGVDVMVGAKVIGLNGEGGRISSVVVENMSGHETMAADMVVNSAGITPNTGFIDVRKAKNGAILVNDRMETSAPDVYAAGDCSVMTSFITGEHQYSPLGTNANKQGRIIAEILAGKPAPRLKLLGSSCLRLFSLDAAKVGLSEIDAQKLNLDYRANFITGSSFASYYAPGKIILKLVYEASSRKILGAQAVGEGVVAARANYFAVAISAGLTVDEFAFLDLCYSPPFSGVWDATLVAANTAK